MFTRLALLGSFGLVVLFAQGSHKFEGVVVDPDGMPISGAQVDFQGGPAFWGRDTDQEGRFEIETPGLIAVVRKAGYRSERIRTDASQQIHVTLRATDRRIGLCTEEQSCDSIGSFCFPRVAGVSPGRLTNDVDYTMRTYWLTRTRSGIVGGWQSMLWFLAQRGIKQGVGPNWTRGVPSLRDVSQAADYEEAGIPIEEGPLSKLEYPIGIIDAKGTNIGGKRWRYLGLVGESAEYRDLGRNAARLLDRVLDGVCIRQR